MAIFLFLGLIFTPNLAKASFLSEIFGNPASASSTTPNTVDNTKNSQTMALLQANSSSVMSFQDKNSKDAPADTIKEDTNVNILSDNALVPATTQVNPAFSTDDTDTPLVDQISVYVVRKGDNISQIADMFGVSVNTILSANDMKKGEKLVEGDTLLILPISGIEHTVTKGQTIATIAKLYKVDASDITTYNGIADNAKLVVGDKLVIPGADGMTDEGGDKPAPNLGASIAKDTNYYLSHPLLNILGFFINPVPTGRKTQGLHGPGHRGIDIGAPTGTPIYASASGTVIAEKNGCKVGRRSCGGGYGNMVIIEHANNTRTLYAHMSKLVADSGSTISRGQIIGYVGSTGHSTGPHLHFEVFNAKNPGADWSWAN